MAADGGPDYDLQAHALADGRRCLQTDGAAFRRVALAVIDDTRSFELADDFAGHRACAAEVVLVIAASASLGADDFELSDCDGTLSPEEREQLLHVLGPAD